MIGAPSSPNFERSGLRGTGPDDMDLEAVWSWLAVRAPRLPRGSEEELVASAVRTGLLVSQGSSTVASPVGLLLFGHLPQLMYPHWGIGAVRIDGRCLSDRVLARVDLEGPLPDLLAGGLAFVEEHTHRIADQVEGPAAAGVGVGGESVIGLQTEYPTVAVREALVNALVHRDLKRTGRVGIHIFDDRLEVVSPGALPGGVPPLDELSVAGGESLPRNPLLAAGARALGIGEHIGRGLTLIRRVMSGDSVHRPARIVASPSAVRVVLPSALVPDAAGELA